MDDLCSLVNRRKCNMTCSCRSCFPQAIISRILLCGLQDYHEHNLSDALSTAVNPNLPKMASVISILSHLTVQHGDCLEQALWSLFEVCTLSLLLACCSRKDKKSKDFISEALFLRDALTEATKFWQHSSVFRTSLFVWPFSLWLADFLPCA